MRTRVKMTMRIRVRVRKCIQVGPTKDLVHDRHELELDITAVSTKF